MDCEMERFGLGDKGASKRSIAAAEIGDGAGEGFAAWKRRIKRGFGLRKLAAGADAGDEGVDWVGGPGGLDLLREAGVVFGEEVWGGGEEGEGGGGRGSVEGLVEVAEAGGGEFVAHFDLEGC